LPLPGKTRVRLRCVASASRWNCTRSEHAGACVSRGSVAPLTKASRYPYHAIFRATSNSDMFKGRPRKPRAIPKDRIAPEKAEQARGPKANVGC
jgi:hypothetical protein